MKTTKNIGYIHINHLNKISRNYQNLLNIPNSNNDKTFTVCYMFSLQIQAMMCFQSASVKYYKRRVIKISKDN